MSKSMLFLGSGLLACILNVVILVGLGVCTVPAVHAASHCTSGGLFAPPPDGPDYSKLASRAPRMPGTITGKYAVLISGNSGACKPYLNDLSFLYTTLVNKYGFAEEDIFVIQYWNGAWDFDGDWTNDSDYSATRANIFAVFDTLDYNRDVDEDDLVLVFITDHGGRDNTYGSYISLIDDEILWATEFDSLFTNLEDEDVANYWPHLLAVVEPCKSGGFVDEMSPYAKRAICSAAKATETSYWDGGTRGSGDPNDMKSTNYDAFAYWWIAAVNGAHPEGDTTDADKNGDGYVSFKEAFIYAESHDEYALKNWETPQYFDYSPGYGSMITLDGVELSSPWAGLCRGIHSRVNYGGASAWGDGGTGDCLASGVVVEMAGSLSPGERGVNGAQVPVDLYAKVRNSGSLPVTSVLARFYYGVPSTIASASDTSLHYIGSASVGFLAPDDTALVGPAYFNPPPVNAFGQPYWKLFATLEAMESPMESGWVHNDMHVGVENYHCGESLTGEPVELLFRVENPTNEPRRIVLSLARNTLPEGWLLDVTPALGETLDVAPGEQLMAVANVFPDGIHGPTGIVTIEEELLGEFGGCVAYCEGDSGPATPVYEGGFIMTTGGISFEVTAPYEPISVPLGRITDFAASVSSEGILLCWLGCPELEHYYELMRRSPDDADFTRIAVLDLNDADEGRFRFLDRDVVAGQDYTYQVNYAGYEGVLQSFPPVVVRAEAPALFISSAYPNPSGAGVCFSYSMPFQSPVTVSVFDVSGRLLRRADLGTKGPGAYSFIWDGKDMGGNRLPAGTYIVRLKTKEGTSQQTVVLVR